MLNTLFDSQQQQQVSHFMQQHTRGSGRHLALHFTVCGGAVDTGHDVGVIHLLTAATRGADCDVADGDAARDVLVARHCANPDEAAAVTPDLAEGAPSAVDPALRQIDEAAFLSLLAARFRPIAAEKLARPAAGNRQREGTVGAAALAHWVHVRHDGGRVLVVIDAGDIDLTRVDNRVLRDHRCRAGLPGCQRLLPRGRDRQCLHRLVARLRAARRSADCD
jgi:hypothetical protein